MPDSIRELRALIRTSRNKAYTAASAAGWAAGTAHVLPITSVDLTKLVHQGIESKALQRRLYESDASKAGLSASELSFSIPLGMGSANTTAPFEATLLAAFFGGLASPTAKTDLCEADCTTTVLNATGHGMSAGMAVLVGAPGDGRGGGEVRRIASVDTNTITLEMALAGAPSTGDALVYSHTVYLDQSATQNYLDILGIGFHAEDQFQCLGCMGPVTLSGLAEGEEPTMNFNLTVPQWQEVPVGERDQLEPSVAFAGSGQAPTSKATGAFFLGDWGSTTRAAVESADWSIDPGLKFEYRKDANYENRMGACKRVPGRVTAGITVYADLDFGLHADFPSTAKQLLWQFGNTAQACVAITMPRALLTSKPARKAINNMSGLSLALHGKEPTVAATPANLYSSAIAVHWF